MKKTIFSGIFILVFIMYALYQNFGGGSSLALATTTNFPVATNTGQTQTAQQTTATKIPQTTTKTQTPSAPIVTRTPTPASTPTPAPQPTGQYKDGIYTGPVADAYYGNIQVQAIISGGKLTDVQFLQYPSDRSHSIAINTRAMPILKSEAIAVQSASVNIVSGATDSSQAFQQSLGSALSQAKA